MTRDVDGGPSDAACALALAFFSLLILLPGAFSPSQITRGDVTMYVLPNVLSLLERPGPWFMYWNAKIDFSKPPLFHWALLLSVRAFGGTFLALRLPALLCTAASTAATFLIGRLLGLERRRAALAGLLLLSCWGVFDYGRQPLLEAPLLAALLTAFYALLRAVLLDEPAWLVVCGAAVGVSAMIKWAVGPATFALFAAGFLAPEGRWKALAQRPGWAAAGAAAAAVFALPYPIFALLRHGDAFKTQLFSQLVSERFREPTPLSEYLGRALVVNTLPWTPLVLAALWRARRADAALRRALVPWLAASLIPGMLIVSRSDRYAYPALPALALLVSGLLDERERYWRAASGAAGLLLAAGGLAAAAALWRLRLLPAPLAILAAGAGLAAAALLRRANVRRTAGAAACAALLLALVVGAGYGAAGFNAVPPRVLALIGTRHVARFDNSPEAASTGYLPLYLGRAVPILGTDDALTEGLAVVSRPSLGRLEAAAGRAGLKSRVLTSWENYHTNPRGAGLKLLAMLRARSLAPLAVEHVLVELSR